MTHLRGVRPFVALVLASSVSWPCFAADCPTADMINAAAWEVAGASPPRDAITWRVDDPELLVVVISSTGAVTQRQINAHNLTCDEMAQAIALVWAAVELGSPELAMSPPRVSEDPKLRAPSAADLHAQVSPVNAKTAPSPRPASFAIETEAAALAAWSGEGAAPALGLGLAVLPSRHWGLRFSLGYVGQMHQDIGPGQGQWTRSRPPWACFVVGPGSAGLANWNPLCWGRVCA